MVMNLELHDRGGQGVDPVIGPIRRKVFERRHVEAWVTGAPPMVTDRGDGRRIMPHKVAVTYERFGEDESWRPIFPVVDGRNIRKDESLGGFTSVSGLPLPGVRCGDQVEKKTLPPWVTRFVVKNTPPGGPR